MRSVWFLVSPMQIISRSKDNTSNGVCRMGQRPKLVKPKHVNDSFRQLNELFVKKQIIQLYMHLERKLHTDWISFFYNFNFEIYDIYWCLNYLSFYKFSTLEHVLFRKINNKIYEVSFIFMRKQMMKILYIFCICRHPCLFSMVLST